MPWLLLLSLCLPQPQEAGAAVASPDWAAVRMQLSAEEQRGFDFLIANMPASDRAKLDPELLVENVRYAYRAWHEAPWHEAVSENLFLNEILPYANINERRDRWRKDFYERFRPLVAAAKTPSEAAAILNNKIFPQLGVIYSTKRPKADQSPYESIEAGMASCTGLSVLLVDACRSVGVPARFVGTPLWADGSGNHSWVEVWDQGWHFTGAAEPTGEALDQAWFTGRAAQAVADDRDHAIYAVSFRRTPLTLPMVWQPEADSVHAVNVTQRYLQAEALPEDMVHLAFRATWYPLEQHGETKDVQATEVHRVAAEVELRDQEGNTFFKGKTHDDSFDANDHLTVAVPRSRPFQIISSYGPR